MGTLIALMVAEGEDWREVEIPASSSSEQPATPSSSSAAPSSSSSATKPQIGAGHSG